MKLEKFLNSAFGNSNAFEAAQALKMAAAQMQKEGINPADVLAPKGGAGTRAELTEAREIAIKWYRRSCELEQELEAYQHLYRSECRLSKSHRDKADMYHRKAVKAEMDCLQYEREAREAKIALVKLRVFNTIVYGSMLVACSWYFILR